LAVVIIAVGCSGSGNNSLSQNGQNNRTAEPQPAAQSSRPPENVPTPTPSKPVIQEAGPIGSTATPSDSYRTAHILRAKKDVEGLKQVMSNEILEFFTEMGKLEKKSLDEMLLQLVNKPQAPNAEVRDEKITGNRAVLEFKDENGKWTEMDFVKEGGGWKLTLPPKANSVKKPETDKK